MTWTKNILPEDSEARKRIPVCTGLYDYFPAAIEALVQYHQSGDFRKESLGFRFQGSFADKVALLLPLTGQILPEGPRASVVLAWECLDAALDTLVTGPYEVSPSAGFVDYFAPVLAAIAALSWAGNNKHNPGQPLHWSRWLSPDHRDCIARHSFDFDGTGADGMRHCVTTCWRALAVLQLELEAEGAPVARGARVHEDPCSELTRLTEEYGGYEAQDEPTQEEKRRLLGVFREAHGGICLLSTCCRAAVVGETKAANWLGRVCFSKDVWDQATTERETKIIAALEKDLAQCP